MNGTGSHHSATTATDGTSTLSSSSRSPGTSTTNSTASTSISTGIDAATNNAVLLLNRNHNHSATEPDDVKYRAIHQIDTSALSHNYNCVEAAASQQKCNVIVVVKADGYGHGAIESALHLADSVGADAFAVATLEEGIALRKALLQKKSVKRRRQTSSVTVATTSKNNSRRNSPLPPDMRKSAKASTNTSTSTPTINNRKTGNTPATTGTTLDQLSKMFQPPTAAYRAESTTTAETASTAEITAETTATATISTTTTISATPCILPPTASPAALPVSRRSAFIRILVLGPPVGFPRCFDDYLYHNIECVVSGPEVAAALLDWVNNPMDRQLLLVERVAQETKQQFDKKPVSKRNTTIVGTDDDSDDDDDEHDQDDCTITKKSATLSGTSGRDLANEFRQLLLNHQKEKVVLAANVKKPSPPPSSGTSTPSNIATASATPTAAIAAAPFGGIEAATLSSLSRERVAAVQQVFVEDNSSETGATPALTTLITSASSSCTTLPSKRKLRWHALVDTGMGRVGFRTDYPQNGERRDTVEILQELIQAEHSGSAAPLEFFGMCTHMADATSTSSYTNEQITKFKSLLKRVRDAGISVPTVSTDNSAALLTTSLTHFDPDELLNQSGLNSRGFVRTGGAIYGQRPSFTQLRPVSTLLAAVRHVAILKEGESCGYDRAYIATHAVRIATLTIGFADGYPRDLGNGRGHVAIRNKLYPVAGNVCMDMMMVDLGPATSDNLEDAVRVGDVAVLWGGDSGVPLKDLAAALKTTQSALTCGLNKTRVLREYV